MRVDAISRFFLALEDFFGRKLSASEKVLFSVISVGFISLLGIGIFSLVATRAGKSAVSRSARQERIAAISSTAEFKLEDWVTSEVTIDANRYASIQANPDLKTVERYAIALVGITDEDSRRRAVALIPWANKSAQGQFTQPIAEPLYYAVSKRVHLVSSGKSYGAAQEVFFFTFDNVWVGKDNKERPVREVVSMTFAGGKLTAFTTTVVVVD